MRLTLMKLKPSTRSVISLFAAILACTLLPAQSSRTDASSTELSSGHGQQQAQASPRLFVFNFNLPDSGQLLADRSHPGCPVSMRAQQRTSVTGLTRTGDGNAVQGQRIHLDVDRGPHAVVAIQVTVHGTTARPRIYAAQSLHGASDALKTFTLTADGASANGVAISSDILLRGFTSVQSVNLDSVSYADGSLWTPTAGKSCSVEPDPLMLVSSR